MVWSHRDFARELHRQLVEIASIRKRSEGNADVLERLSLLEESHHYLLRKLEERIRRATASSRARPTSIDRHPADPHRYSPRGVDPTGSQPQRQREKKADLSDDVAVDEILGGVPSSGGRTRMERRPSESPVQIPIDECLKSLQGKLEHLAKTAIEAADSRSRLPHGQRCPYCGEVMLPGSTTERELVVWRVTDRFAWCHRRCVSGAEIQEGGHPDRTGSQDGCSRDGEAFGTPPLFN